MGKKAGGGFNGYAYVTENIEKLLVWCWFVERGKKKGR